jgi:hypothetical protein
MSRGWTQAVRLVAMTALGAALALASPPAVRRWTFEDDEPGAAPAGFDLVTTLDAPPGRWVIERDGEGKVLAQLDADTTDRRFAMAVARDATYTDLRLSVRGKPISGDVDQAVGLVWRWQDADNYYVARSNVLERNVRLYRVVNGNRIKFAGVENVELATGTWHTLKIEHVGARIRVFVDDRELFEAEDRTFAGAGRIGVWTKADSVTSFDDLTAELLEHP